MKITFITTQQSFWGGSEYLWVKCAGWAIAQGHMVQCVVYEQKEGLHPLLLDLKSKAHAFVQVKNRMPELSLGGKLVKALKDRFLPETYKEVYQFSPDCLFISQGNSYSAAFHNRLNSFLLRFNKPFFLISHFNKDHEGLTYGDIEKARRIFKKASCTFFVSQRNKEACERQIAQHISPAKIIGNPLNLKKIDYIPYPAVQGSIQFASVARLEVNYKGQDILFQVLAQPSWRQRKWHLNIYGTGPDEKYLMELSRFYNINSRITFHGHVADVTQIWSSNHAFLFPSTGEGKPLALQEAMLCGRICIASDVGGNADVVDDGINGYVATSFFPKPFSETLERAWNEIDNWDVMGRKGHNKMMETLDFAPHETLLSIINQS